MKHLRLLPVLFFLLTLTLPARADAPPHSIILFIGDGMGANQRLAAQWLSVGQNGQLAMDALPFSGWSQTANRTGGITDSVAFQWAATGTHRVTLTVQNPGDTVTASRSVVVADSVFSVYLPLILK